MRPGFRFQDNMDVDGHAQYKRPGPNEAGPSGTQHTPMPSPTLRPPSPTLVANTDHPDPDPTPRPQSGFPASQATLVAPEPTQQNSEPRDTQRRKARKAVSPILPQPQRQPVQTAPQSSPTATRQLQDQDEATVAGRTRASTRRQARAARPPAAPSEPFRNTRSRSRSVSVEPLVQQPSTRGQSQEPSGLLPIGETYEDEVAVENVLANISEGSTSTAAVEDLLSDDDMETMQQLVGEADVGPVQNPGASSSATRSTAHSGVPPNRRSGTTAPETDVPEVIPDSDDDDIFKQLDQESRESLVRSIHPSRPQSSAAERSDMTTATQSRVPAPAPFVDLRALSKSRGPSKTPVPAPRPTPRGQRAPVPPGSGAASTSTPRRRQMSTDSAATTQSSDFPSPQTRAAQWQKDTPYKPDAGTRAARAAMRRMKR